MGVFYPYIHNTGLFFIYFSLMNNGHSAPGNSVIDIFVPVSVQAAQGEKQGLRPGFPGIVLKRGYKRVGIALEFKRAGPRGGFRAEKLRQTAFQAVFHT